MNRKTANSKMAKLISPERVVELLDCYGANPEAWPDDERATALALIQHSTELQNLQRQAAQLDKLLVGGGMQPNPQEAADPKLVSRIVGNLPAQAKARKYGQRRDGCANTRRPLVDFSGWTSMVAASIAVLAITLSIMEFDSLSTNLQPQSSVSQPELEYWMWRQVTGETEIDTDDDEEEPMTLMALIDLG
jgi:hypothetical protein